MNEWTPTPAALALLQRIEERKKAQERFSTAMQAKEEKRRRKRQADENELKYGEQLTYSDRMTQCRDDRTANRYDSIQSLAGRNGGCTTRRGTYRRLKYGKGNVGRRGFEKQGFEENQ